MKSNKALDRNYITPGMWPQVSTSRSRGPLRPRPWSRHGRIGKRLGLSLGIKGLGLGIGLGQLGLVHKSFFHTYALLIFLQNAIMWPQVLVLFVQVNSLPCSRLLHYRPTQYSFNQHTILKSIDLQANISPKTSGLVSKPMDVSVLASVLESRALVLVSDGLTNASASVSELKLSVLVSVSDS